MKPVLISGIQPSGKLHLGNYLGALKNFVDLQNSGQYDCYFFIADLHSLTENYTPEEKRKQILNLAADYLAVGLDPSTSLGTGPKKSVIFQQSHIPAHSELAFILNTITPMGELERMTQYKTKMEVLMEMASKKMSGRRHATAEVTEDEYQEVRGKYQKIINVGLFEYPVLMAADILLYDAKFVPVGEDQLQHLELARTLARKFNSRFGKIFIEPQPLLTKSPRVMSLGDPTKKMSKSIPQTCLFIEDSPEEIKSKIKRAVTDSGSEVKFDQNKKPGLSNLLNIYSALSEKPLTKIEKEFAGQNYGEFKSALADLITNHLASYRVKKKKLLTSSLSLLTTLNAGSKKASLVANKKITEVKNKIGLGI